MSEDNKVITPFTKRELSDAIDFTSQLPDTIIGMKLLDKSHFSIKVSVPSIRCKSKCCAQFQRTYKSILLNRPSFPSIVSLNTIAGDERLVLLNPLISGLDKLNDEQKDLIEKEKCELSLHEFSLKYDDFSMEEVFRKVLPGDHAMVSSFETIGHIAHVNLKDSLLDYKKLIGEVILNKNTHIKTVVNKTSSIDETFRFFKMELLAGKNDMVAKVIEHGCTFKFDYSKVYWNSRLQTEHNRLVKRVKQNDVIFDVFAGVGPFSIPMAKKKCIVYANDLNKDSFEALNENIIVNKIDRKNISTFNMDGRKFIEDVIIERLIKKESNENENIHIIMNLPAIGLTFLDVFREKFLYFNFSWKILKQVFVHCYCFSTDKSPEEDVKVRISQSIGYDISSNNCSVRFVRRVAPNKVMVCATFNLMWIDKVTTQCNCCDFTNTATETLNIKEGPCPKRMRTMVNI